MGFLVVLALAGCGKGETQGPAESGTFEQAQSRPVSMPDLRGSTVESLTALVWLLEATATVTFPATEATWSVEATRVAGSLIPTHVAQSDFPTRSLPFSSVRGALHTVVSQEPSPGSPLSSETTFSMLVGSHPNATGLPWASHGHARAVAGGGATQCFDCHDPERCSQCHAALPD